MFPQLIFGGKCMKNRIIFKSKSEISKWLDLANLFAKSMCSYNEVLKQFNNLNSRERIEIKKQLNMCDEIRKTKIPIADQEAWRLGIMVDAHIIATQYDIDPLTVISCLNPICKPNEKLYIR